MDSVTLKSGSGLEFHALHAADRNVAALELQLNAAAELRRYIVLAGGSGPDLQANGRGVLVKILQAQDARAIPNRLRPRSIATQFRGGGFQRLQRFFLRELGRERNVHEGLRPVTAEIRDGADVAVRKRDQRPARVANHRAAQGDVLDAPDGVPNLDGVTDDELIFKDDVEATDDVAHQILRPKPERQA